MRRLFALIRSIKPQVYVAYGLLAVVILSMVTGAVLGTRTIVRNNTIEIGDLHSESRIVEGSGVSEVDVILISGLGQLDLAGGANDLLELDFVSNVPKMHPVIWYSEDSGVGDLIVTPSVPAGIPDLSKWGEYKNEWDVRLNDNTPLDLDIVLGTGLGHLDLRGLALTALGVEVGAGEATIDLRGEWGEDFHAAIDGGAGKTTVLLPDGVGVLATVDQPFGDLNIVGLQQQDEVYVNAAYGHADVTLALDVDIGTGELSMIVLGEDSEYSEVQRGQETK